MIFLFILYWFVVGALFVVGIIMLIVKASNNQPVKDALKLIIASVIMFVIGAGACAFMLSGLGSMH